MTFNIMMRNKVFVWDDPMRRCYNGAFGDHHYEWGRWTTLELNVAEADIERRLEFWRDLNAYAVSARGESARTQYKAERIQHDQVLHQE